MATREVKVCDKYGTTKGVRSYRITIDVSTQNHGEYEVVSQWYEPDIDLSPKALKMLQSAIERALQPPKKRATNE